MTKSIILILLLATTVEVTKAQNSTWLFDKSVKTTSFIGKGIKDYNRTNKELLRDPMSQVNSIAVRLDTSKINNSEIEEFQTKTRDFYMSFFSLASVTMTDLKMYNPIEYSCSFETVKKMPNNSYFVYSGQSADSVVFEFAFSRTTETDISAALSKITTSLTGAGVNLGAVNQFIPLFDSTKLNTLDTLRFKYTLRDPNSLFRVQVIKKKSTKFDPSGSNYSLFFPSLTDADVNNISDETILTYGTATSVTRAEKPRFGWLRPENNNVAFKLVIDKKNSELHLGVEYTDGETNTVWFTSKKDGDKIFWRETKLIHPFDNASIKKLVYVTVFAESISNEPNKIKVTNKIATSGAKVTFMSYPEIKLKYLK